VIAAAPFPVTFLYAPDHRVGVVFGIAATACLWVLAESVVLNASRLTRRNRRSHSA